MKKCFTVRKSERGQAFTELAISMVFLLTLLAAVVDLGWAFYELIALRDMTQEAAAYGSMFPCQTKTSTGITVINPEIEQRLRGSATAPIPSNSTSLITTKVEIIDQVTKAPGGAIAYGNSVRVTATYPHKIVTPFVGSFIGNKWEYPLKVDVSDTILQTECKEVP